MSKRSRLLQSDAASRHDRTENDEPPKTRQRLISAQGILSRTRSASLNHPPESPLRSDIDELSFQQFKCNMQSNEQTEAVSNQSISVNKFYSARSQVITPSHRNYEGIKTHVSVKSGNSSDTSKQSKMEVKKSVPTLKGPSPHNHQSLKQCNLNIQGTSTNKDKSANLKTLQQDKENGEINQIGDKPSDCRLFKKTQEKRQPTSVIGLQQTTNIKSPEQGGEEAKNETIHIQPGGCSLFKKAKVKQQPTSFLAMQGTLSNSNRQEDGVSNAKSQTDANKTDDFTSMPVLQSTSSVAGRTGNMLLNSEEDTEPEKDSLVDVHHDSSVPSIQDNDTALTPTPTSTFTSTSCTPRISDINPKPSVVHCEQAYGALDPLVSLPTLIVLQNDGTGSCLSGVTDFFDVDETDTLMGVSFETSHQPDDIPDFRTPSPQLTSCSSNNSNSRGVSKENAPSKIGINHVNNQRTPSHGSTVNQKTNNEVGQGTTRRQLKLSFSEVPLDLNIEDLSNVNDFEDLLGVAQEIEVENIIIDTEMSVTEEVIENESINDEEISPKPSQPVSNRPKERYTNTRKRTRNPRMWKKNIAKQGLNSGVEHLNQKGKLIPARQMRAGCHPTLCRYACHDKISEEARKQFFETYWSLGDHQKQWSFIDKFVKQVQPETRKFVLAENAKKYSKRYYIPKGDGTDQRVCQTMFLETLSISEKCVRTAGKKVEKNGMIVSPDKRGSIPKLKPGKEAIISRMDEHIQSFEAVPSHFCRKSVKRKYLEPGLSITRLHLLYVKWMAEKYPLEAVGSERMYRDHFNEHYNYGFHLPRKDQCELCNVYARGNDAFRATIQGQFDTHLKENRLAIHLKRQDRKEAGEQPNKICFAAFDFQKQLNTPKDETSLLYYKRKLSTLNFTVVDAQGNKLNVTCYCWNESEGKKGANEVASCLRHFIKKVKEERGEVVDIRLWADNCFGQNKNKFVNANLLSLAHELKVNIKLRFLETGHTMNECDTVHAHIEDAAKTKTIYTSEQWYNLIVNDTLTKAKTKYKVERMYGKFLDFHPLAENMQKWDGKGVQWKKVREVEFDPSKGQGVVGIRYSLDPEAPVKEVDVTRSVPGRPVNFAKVQFKSPYRGKLKLKVNKLKDLAKLCQLHIIPEEEQGFYRSLPGIPLEGGAPDVEYIPSDDEGAALEGMNEPDEDYEQRLKDFNAANNISNDANVPGGD